MAVKAVTIGFFDGVHIGHRRVLNAVLSKGGEASVITFWPHPRAVLQQDARGLNMLTSCEEKLQLIRQAGIDDIQVVDFTRDFARMTSDEFIDEVLLRRMHCTHLVLGYDNRIGSDGLSTEQLASLAADKGLEVEIVPPCILDGVQVSSTKIREALSQGDVRKAEAMLGAPYSISGVVVPGNRIGRTIGYPTANILPSFPLKAIPSNGVYSTKVEIGGRVFRGMTNIGIRPTVSESGQRMIETHVLDFNEDIYGLEIRISFMSRIRQELKFQGLEQLTEQLSQDEISVRNSFVL